MLWWVLKLNDGNWEIDEDAVTTPTPAASATDLSILPEEHLHIAEDLTIAGAEVMAMSASSAIIRAEDLRRSFVRFRAGEKDELILNWFDKSGKNTVYEERLANTGIYKIVEQLGMPHEIGIKRVVDGALHAARFRRIDHKIAEVPPPQVMGNGNGNKANHNKENLPVERKESPAKL